MLAPQNAPNELKKQQFIYDAIRSKLYIEEHSAPSHERRLSLP